MFANALLFAMCYLPRVPSMHYCQLPSLSNEHTSQDEIVQMNFLIFQRQSVLLVPPPPLGCSFRDEKSLSKQLLPFHPCSFLIGDGSVEEDLRKGTELESNLRFPVHLFLHLPTTVTLDHLPG